MGNYKNLVISYVTSYLQPWWRRRAGTRLQSVHLGVFSTKAKKKSLSDGNQFLLRGLWLFFSC